MYSEQVNIKFDRGLHGETLKSFATHIEPGWAYINGIDVSDIEATFPLSGQRDVVISANTGDPATDKNLVDIIHGIANFGHDPWRENNKKFPPQLLQQIADWVRSRPEFGLQMQSSAPLSNEMATQSSMTKEAPSKQHMKGVSPKRNRQYEHIKKKLMDSGKSEEEAKEIAARTVNKQRAEKGETKSKLAKWSVVSLGESQLPGAVGIEPHNPIVDGPNPHGPNFRDNAQNSQEQEMAFQTWVNFAVDMLNRGDGPALIIAKLADKGCPDPEAVLQTALKQPLKEETEPPVTDQIGQDPFQAPMPEDPTSAGEMQDVYHQPPVVQSKVRVAGTSLTGVEIDRWEDLWGQGIVKIALDDGGTINVAPEALEEITPESPEHPVSQIQKFIDSLPKIEPTRPHIQARIDNLELVRRAVRSTISKVGFSDQVKLMKIDTDAHAEIMALKESLGAIVSESDVDYLIGQQIYRPHGLDFPGVKRAVVHDDKFNKRLAEQAAIFVAELPENMISSSEDVAYAAAYYASGRNGDVANFVRLAEENRDRRVKELGLVDNITAMTGLDINQMDDRNKRELAASYAEQALQREQRNTGIEPDSRSLNAINVARLFARGEASEDELHRARKGAYEAMLLYSRFARQNDPSFIGAYYAARAAYEATNIDVDQAVDLAASLATAQMRSSTLGGNSNNELVEDIYS